MESQAPLDPSPLAKTLLDVIADFYCDSRDFNGIPVRNTKLALDELRPLLRELLQKGLVSIVFGDIHPNPHIMALEPEPTAEQLRKLDLELIKDACLYPTEAHLTTVVDRSKYEGRPFTLLLALGSPQLAYKAFDLSILETYRNDPRFSYKIHDMGGSIHAKDQHIEAGHLREGDQVFLQTLGFGYSPDLDRVVIVYLRYLSDLSPEHQQLWQTKMLNGDYTPHPDYYRSSILGGWPTRVSIFVAFLGELHQINKMCDLMGRPHLFLEDFQGDKRPKGFAFLLRPTAKEYREFAQLLDKMIGDNLNRKFFLDEVTPHFERAQQDGSVLREPKGTISMLKEWIDQTIKFPDPAPKDEMIETFKAVRKERQPGAHVVEDDVFDQQYFKKQRQLILDAYKGARTLRLILANHPAAATLEIPEWLQSGKFWTR